MKKEFLSEEEYSFFFMSGNEDLPQRLNFSIKKTPLPPHHISKC